ncbi:peptidyl-prolyl cis-trans isomerase B (cyclophilin B) [Frondihabitans sp. PhB188]|uniref:peptidylprolyl isomerase n=1 Tax=Frondihabitans sp. PhB188 TaxID=2485200 RepID=UPI000F4AA615|nr:peptidylprolyl isomerase [Frondihabitans sp. PhB188]ROQ41055.1 peptidyl-prolyl cis-trans isomerase B (cyclophilin B) [Frondihabitans sp. PhB188]
MTPSKNDGREARERLRRYTARQKVHQHQVKRRFRDNLSAIIAVVVIGALGTGTQIVYANGGFDPKPSATASASATPTASSTAAAGANTGEVPSKLVAKSRTWTGSMTLNGDVELGIELDGTKAPQAASVLITLIEKDFYEGTHCWRMSNAATAKFLQCGASKADGSGDAGFAFGPLENVPADNTYDTGVIAMARSTDPYSQATQFFIVYGSTVLDGSTGGYTVVGKVTSGLSSMEKDITDKGLTAVNSETDGSPKVATTITAATIK